MKSTVKIIIWSCVAAVIVTVMTVLLVVPSLVSGININFGIPFMRYSFEDASKYNVGGTTITDSGKIDSIDSIDIDWVSGEVIVTEGTENEIIISESSEREMDDDEQLRWCISGGELRIKHMRPSLFFRDNTKTLTITLPEGISLSEFSISTISAAVNVPALEAKEYSVETVSGSVSLSGVETDSFEFDSVSGRVVINGITAQSAEFDSASGSIEITDCNVPTIETDTVSGEFSVTYTDDALPEELEFDTTSGKISIGIPESLGFSLDRSAVSGELFTTLPVSKSGGTVKYGDRPRFSIECNSVSGDVMIFAK